MANVLAAPAYYSIVDSEFKLRDTLCVLRLKGRFQTGSNADYFRALDELKRLGARAVVLDCSELECLDSTGLTFVVGLYNTFSSSAGWLALANANPRVTEILRITRLERVLPVYGSVGEAAAAR
jgi:anti-sigma B factor antagonist